MFKEVNYTLKFLELCRKNNKTLQKVMKLAIDETKTNVGFHEH
jgi:hypothetical protein